MVKSKIGALIAAIVTQLREELHNSHWIKVSNQLFVRLVFMKI